LSVIEEEQGEQGEQQQYYQREHQNQEDNPMAVFLYALKAPETKRQWPPDSKCFLVSKVRCTNISINKRIQNINLC
jgi:hypothetical protein